jgi:hypothetical protein
MLAAQLIAHGKRPYLDFFFPHALLNVFWNIGWMRVLGESWRALHAVAAAATATAIFLTGRLLKGREAVVAVLLIGLHAAVIQYGTVAAPYALVMLLLATAVYFTMQRKAIAAGFCASAAAASSLLVAPAPLVLLVWMWKQKQSGAGRRPAPLAFLAGAALPWLPVLWWTLRAPRVVRFNLFDYQLSYRRTNWEDATPHDWSLLMGALTSPHVVILVLLAVIGLWRVKRPELRLCGWLAAAIGIELCLAHPTFDWYFVMVVPFLAIPAAAGLVHLIRRPVILLALLAIFCASSALTLYRDRGRFTWALMEAVAAKTSEVTPAGAPLWADEPIYFLLRRPPVEGTECAYAEVIDLPPALAAEVHIVHLDELQRRAASGAFHTVETCDEQPQIDDLDLPRIFRQHARVGRCQIFWN